MKLQQLIKKYRKSLLVTTGIFLTYTILGFLVVPWGVQRYLSHTLAGQLQHPVSVARVRFNPFLIKLEISGFAIQEKNVSSGQDASPSHDVAPLLSFEHFLVDYNVLSVFRLRYGIEQIALEKPFVKLDANGKGGYTLIDAFSNMSSGEQQNEPADPPSAIPNVWLGKLSITDGKINYHDPARAGGFRQLIDLPTIAIEDFSTRASEHANKLALEIRDEDQGVISLETVIHSMEPFRLTGSLSVQQLNLAPLWQWLMLPVNFQLQAPRFALNGQFDLQANQPLDFLVNNATLSLSNLSISSKENPAAPVIQLPLLAVNNVQLNLAQQRVTVGQFQADNGVIDLVMDKQGVSNLQTLFAPVDTSATATTQTSPADPSTPASPVDSTATTATTNNNPAPAKPWDVLMHQVRINNYTVNVRDEKPKEPFALSLTPLTIAIDEWKPLSADRFAIQINSGLTAENIPQPAQLVINTQLQLTPLMVDAHLDLQSFPLVVVQPYVHDAVLADIRDGKAGAVLDIHVDASSGTAINVGGSANVKNLLVNEKAGDKKLLRWDGLDIAGLSFKLPANQLKIDKITLTKPDTGFTINADGSTNVQRLMVAAKTPSAPDEKTTATNKTATSAKTETGKAAPAMSMEIGQIVINSASLGFADLTMKPNFKVGMYQLSGSISGLSSNPKTQATINLKGKVDRYAPVVIDGKLNPLASKPSLNTHMGFKNLELTTFTPYSGTYAGFKIEKGQLSLDIDYKLVDNKIEGKNKIVMNQFQLGESVQSPKAVDLPLRLAIALLKDENGVIDLGFEVGGDLNDPQFSVGGILWKVLSNMVMKVVTSPFKAMASLMGGADAEGVDKIDFAAGQSQLDEASMTKLKTAADLLHKKSGLRVNVQGNSDPDEDRPALQDQKLVNTLMQDNAAPAGTYLSAKSAVEDGGAYRALNRYYKKSTKEDLGDIRSRLEKDMKSSAEKPDGDALKAMAYEQAWKKMRDELPVADDELRQLAMARAEQIKSVLVEQNGIPADKVFVLEVNNDPEKASLTSALTLDVN
ncbi:MAG: DUF748 domain-containing protein [Pseudomonadales bacterium]|nr:DUF748 domain-containing protein [Pseudomonadales bacterium]